MFGDYSHRTRTSVDLAFVLCQTFKNLTNFIEQNTNIYDIKLVYYKNTF
jgi:hypothetical protein